MGVLAMKVVGIPTHRQPIVKTYVFHTSVQQIVVNYGTHHSTVLEELSLTILVQQLLSPIVKTDVLVGGVTQH